MSRVLLGILTYAILQFITNIHMSFVCSSTADRPRPRPRPVTKQSKVVDDDDAWVSFNEFYNIITIIFLFNRIDISSEDDQTSIRSVKSAKR
jgi:hypothetical protein